MWRWVAGLGGAALVTWAVVSRVRSSTSPPSAFWFKAIETFGGRPIDPSLFPTTVAGLNDYLRQCQVGAFFDARDIARPNHPTTAASLGYLNLLPPRAYWPKTAALVAVANQMASMAGFEAELLDHWRPADYNARVDGIAGSPHILAEAIDIDFDTAEGRERAEAYIKGIQRTEPWLKVGIGVGSRRLYVDMLTDSPNRPSTWNRDA